MSDSIYHPYMSNTVTAGPTIQFPQLQMPTLPTPPAIQPTYIQNIPTVNGLDGAKALDIGKNASTLIMDANQNVLYVKSTDNIGAIKSLVAFEMKEIDLNSSSPENDRLSKMENDIAEIKSILSTFKE